uniref:Uncharacterized protein n=1 Tax=Rhizophora mucronata TaxID=61149 RepID=A0A2P2IU83_RHIMU
MHYKLYMKLQKQKCAPSNMIATVPFQIHEQGHSHGITWGPACPPKLLKIMKLPFKF